MYSTKAVLMLLLVKLKLDTPNQRVIWSVQPLAAPNWFFPTLITDALILRQWSRSG